MHKRQLADPQAAVFTETGQASHGLPRGLQRAGLGPPSFGSQQVNQQYFKGLASPQGGRQKLGQAGPQSQGNLMGKNPNKSWADVADAGAHRTPTRLEFFPPSGTQFEIPLVKLPSDVVDECTEYWMNTLVGYFIEK